MNNTESGISQTLTHTKSMDNNPAGELLNSRQKQRGLLEDRGRLCDVAPKGGLQPLTWPQSTAARRLPLPLHGPDAASPRPLQLPTEASHQQSSEWPAQALYAFTHPKAGQRRFYKRSDGASHIVNRSLCKFTRPEGITELRATPSVRLHA